MKEKKKVFVYGTLKKGFYNYYRLGLRTGAKYLTTGSITGFAMHDLGYYPCIVKSTEGDEVHGEVFEILKTDLFKLMVYMEESSGYKAVKVEIDEHDCMAFVYQYPVRGPKISSGVWDKEDPVITARAKKEERVWRTK
jgi:gamma-glutamylcyclotransferase (GGCT)/AIG2-like uncharacterized protein YtfP